MPAVGVRCVDADCGASSTVHSFGLLGGAGRDELAAIALQEGCIQCGGNVVLDELDDQEHELA